MPQNKVTVIDIGSKSISVLIGSRGANDLFAVSGYGEQEYAGYYEGEFLEEDKLFETFQKAINDAQSSANLIIDKVYVGVPAGFCQCKTKTIVQSFGQRIKLREEDLQTIYQGADDNSNENLVLLSCSPIMFVLDDGRKVFDACGQRTSRISATLSFVYAEKQFIEKINSLIKQLGISSVEYLSSTLCESLYLLPKERREEKAILIDCGYIETSVAVIKGDGLLDLKSFAIGGGHISADLSQCLGITFNEAEQLRKQLILSVVPSDSDDYELARNGTNYPISMRKANEITSARLEMMAGLIKKCVCYDGQELPAIPYYITGGGISYTKGAKDILSGYLGVNLTLIYPRDMQLSKPHYSSLLGLMDKALNLENKNNGFFKNLIRKLTGR